jgi:signal transduction histidine kinase
VSRELPVDWFGQIFHTIPDLATPVQVEASLREILEDPALRLYWWDWEREVYVDVHGAPAEALAAEGQVVTAVEYSTRKVGALAHDPALLELPDFLRFFVPAMRIAMERDRLYREQAERLDQLRASRLRLASAADQERRRLQRNLHDGAQQRLIVALLGLRGLEERLRGDAELGPVVGAARAELEGAIEDLRELARGLHPPLLAQRGLAAAIRAGAGRAALPVELDLDIGDGLPHAVEAAAYYVCAEAVTNATKHASATRVTLSLRRVDRMLVAEIGDDGIGGARIEPVDDATGLRGLADRVEALGGRLSVDSPPGRGTRIVATFPLDRPDGRAAAPASSPA